MALAAIATDESAKRLIVPSPQPSPGGRGRLRRRVAAFIV